MQLMYVRAPAAYGFMHIWLYDRELIMPRKNTMLSYEAKRVMLQQMASCHNLLQ